MSRLVVDFHDQRPIWRIPEPSIQRIRAAWPADREMTVVPAPTSGKADGAGEASEEAAEAVRDAVVYLGFGIPPGILRAGAGLRWVHSGTAGVGGSLTPEMLESDVVFTNSAGIHAEPVAETVLAAVLHFARGLDVATRAQARGDWDKAWFDAAESPVRELARSTVGVVGYGGIGREVARRAMAWGARVLALKRTPAAPPSGIELLYGEDGLERILAESDYVILAVPETPETVGLLDADGLARMPRRAVVVNVARGGVVDEDALVAALEAGRLRGAALDVFQREPLPPDHPFWRLPNTLVLPHISSYSHAFWRREADLIVANIECFLNGEPLQRVVDKRLGY